MAEAYIRPIATTGAVLSSFDPETLDFIESLTMDATLSEDYSTTVDWTQHPVEDGADVTDNAVVQLEQVTLSGVITQTLIRGGDASVDRLEEAGNILAKLARDRLPLQVITGLRVLEPYVVTSLTISRSQTTGQSFEFSIDLQELKTVEARFTDVPPAPVREDKKAAAAAKVDGGTKAPTETTPEKEAGEGANPDAEPDTPKSVAATSLDAAKATYNNLLGG